MHWHVYVRKSSPSLPFADKDVHGVPSEEAVSPLSRVAVVSTMHFKSTWLKKFSFMDTQILPFTTAESSTLKVPTMHHTAEVNYGNCSRSRFIEIVFSFQRFEVYGL